ncbi:MAG: hypothetical protein ACRD1Y_14020 [Terriglobales bacterium]
MLVVNWIIAGAIVGFITARFMRVGTGMWLGIAIIRGILGGLLGGWIMHAFGTAAGGGAVSSTWVALLGGFVLTVLLGVRDRIGGLAAAGAHDSGASGHSF